MFDPRLTLYQQGILGPSPSFPGNAPGRVVPTYLLFMVYAQLVHFQSSNISWPLEKGMRFPFSHFGQGGKNISAIFPPPEIGTSIIYLRLFSIFATVKAVPCIII